MALVSRSVKKPQIVGLFFFTKCFMKTTKEHFNKMCRILYNQRQFIFH